MRRGRGLAVSVVAMGLLIMPGTALAKFFPGEEEPPPGVTISGAGFARVAAPARLSDASIQRAIDAAEPTAGTRGVRDARQRATVIAEAVGVRLGQLTRVELEDTLAQFGQTRRHCRPPRRRARQRCRVPAFTAVAATVTFSIVGGAQGSGAPEVEAYGAASAPVSPKKPRSDGSIRQTLGAARVAVTPKAAAAARRNVQIAAGAAGLAVGPIISLSEQRQPYPYFYDAALGSFGPGQFCGVVRRPIFRRDPETGRPRLVRRVRNRACRFPRTLDLRLEAAYEAR